MNQTITEFIEFAKTRKKQWLIPLLVILLGVGALLYFYGGTFSPFIYALF